MARKHDFSVRPYYAGALVGLRSFRIKGRESSHPTLHGPVYDNKFSFGPGENLAYCEKTDPDWKEPVTKTRWDTVTVSGGIGVAIETLDLSGIAGAEAYGAKVTRRPLPAGHDVAWSNLIENMVRTLGEDAARAAIRSLGIKVDLVAKDPYEKSVERRTVEYVKPETAHRAGQQDCTCGFYAYFDTKHNPHHDEESNILGIVQGYGVVTVGDRGFRAEKLKIMALIGTPESKVADPIRWHEFEAVDPTPTRDSYKRPRLVREKVGTEMAIPDKIIEEFAVPVFPTVELALAEYPLTVPELEEEGADE